MMLARVLCGNDLFCTKCVRECVHGVCTFVSVVAERRTSQRIGCAQSMGGRRAISLNTREVN